MDDMLRDAIDALVRVRLAARADGEDIEAMATEAAALAEDIEAARQRLVPADDPEPLALKMRAARKQQP